MNHFEFMKLMSAMIKLLDAPEEAKEKLQKSLFMFMVDMAGQQPTEDLRKSFKYHYELE